MDKREQRNQQKENLKRLKRSAPEVMTSSEAEVHQKLLHQKLLHQKL